MQLLDEAALKELRAGLEFKARKCTVVHQPPQTVTPRGTRTQPSPFHVKLDDRHAAHTARGPGSPISPPTPPPVMPASPSAVHSPTAVPRGSGVHNLKVVTPQRASDAHTLQVATAAH